MADNMIDYLDATGWARLVLAKYADDLLPMSERVKAGYVDPLAEPILAETELGWDILETGSGWGSLSAILAGRGRQVTLMDWGSAIVAKGQDLLRLCGVSSPQGVCADLFAPLPFADNSFDCVWSSGVLEHFRREKQIKILQESARIARHRVISLIPNAWSVAYRLGKWYMIRHNQWDFGYEKPEYSQRQLFIEAGLKNIREKSVDAARSGWFLQGLPNSGLWTNVWHRICQTWPYGVNQFFWQGYMLVTVGDVK